MSTEGRSDDGSDGDSVLVAEYALGLLGGPEHQQVARRIATEPALAAELRLWQARFSGLDNEFAEVAPPAEVLSRIEQRLFEPRQQHAVPPTPVRRFWDSLALWRGIAAGAVAVAVAAIGLALLQPPRLDPDAFASQLVAALQAQEGFGVEFVALYNAATGEVRLTALAGEPVPGRDYELWYIRGDEPAVSMGVIPVEGRAEIELAQEARDRFGPGTVLAVTLEDEGGSPTGAPQGPVVAVGTATPI